MMRWRLKLEEYDFEIIHKKGKLNANADALSRVILEQLNALEDDTSSVHPTVGEDLNKLIEDLLRDEVDISPDNLPNTSFANSVPKKTSKGKDMEILKQFLRPEDENSNTVHSNQEDEPRKSIEISETPIDNKKNQYFIQKNNLGCRVTQDTKEDRKITTVKMQLENNEELILNFMKEYLANTKIKHYLHFDNDKLYSDFCRVYRTSQR